MSDILGKILGVIIAFVLCILAPLTIVTMSDDMVDRRAIYSEMTTFVDQIIDTGELTKEQLADFMYGVSSYGPVCEVKIVRYIRVVNPKAGGGITVSYTPTDIYAEGSHINFNQGDLIQVHVEAVEYTGMQKVARLALGTALRPLDYTVTGRVR